MDAFSFHSASTVCTESNRWHQLWYWWVNINRHQNQINQLISNNISVSIMKRPLLSAMSRLLNLSKLYLTFSLTVYSSHVSSLWWWYVLRSICTQFTRLKWPARLHGCQIQSFHCLSSLPRATSFGVKSKHGSWYYSIQSRCPWYCLVLLVTSLCV